MAKPNQPSPPDELISQTCIGDIPDGVLTHILSFLPTTDAVVETSVVAPRWRYLWHSVPVLEFDMWDFRQNRAWGKSVRRTRQLFVKMLSRALLRRPRHSPVPVQKFTLFFPYNGCYRRYVNSWLNSVIGSETVELYLDFSEHSSSDEDSDEEDSEEESGEDLVEEDENQDDSLFFYKFHYSKLVNTSVAVLNLTCSDLYMPTIELPVKLYLLREIYLENLRVTGNLLASCVNLEILHAWWVVFTKDEDWKIESKSLKHFKLISSQKKSVEICTPNLETLFLSDDYEMKYSLKDVSSLVAAEVKFPILNWRNYARWTNLVYSLGGVKRLAIQNMWSLPERLKKKPLAESYGNIGEVILPVEEVLSETFVFHNLKHVELFTGYSEDDILGLEILLKKCPQLETMVLVNSGDSKGVKGMSIVLHMPRLKLVEMKNFWNTPSELFVACLLKEHGVILDKIVAHPGKEDDGRRPRPPFVL